METRFRSSFIPKNLAENSTVSGGQSSGFLNTLAGLVLLLSLLGIGGLFAYKKIVQNSIEEMKTELSALESAVNRDEIKKLAAFDKKLNAVNSILSGHAAVSEFFTLLEENTLTQVTFLNLNYKAPAGEVISVEMRGQAPSYAVVAEQNRVFSGNPNFVSTDWSGLSVETEKGLTSFSFRGKLQKDIIDYKKKIDATTADDIVGEEETSALEDIEADLFETN